ncbi:hypothetical protein ASG84_08875 [Rhodococcus sp. Leaf278]|uniref:hypothetical protein n=1 Tax=Rhodococcus sp. Leaf278 TaxID=1736319 RepID=UPI000709B987|nr:hypothetical protein [Rhodococcus sp. Leaf278]KQU47212.1 hypothetical protein ASG84_08875 [Rhodococcus sp. Leaf278]
MSTIDEFDSLLRDRFDLDRDDLIAALRTLPAHRPWATRLTAGEAMLLDSAGLIEDPEAYAEVAADITAHMGRLYNTSYSASEVSKGLSVTPSRVRQRRLDHTLWAIDDGGKWVFPSVQFDVVENEADTSILVLVRGLDRVLQQLLPRDLHPTSVASFLLTPQPELEINGRQLSVKQWLLHGEAPEKVLELIEIHDWAAV